MIVPQFPRARVFLDEEDLQVMPECAKMLDRVRTIAQKAKTDSDAATEAVALIDQFSAKFGPYMSLVITCSLDD